MKYLFLLGTSLSLALAGVAPAEPPPSYSHQVKPFLARYCLECHSASVAKGELNLETYQGILKGGKNGSTLVPGRADPSRLVAQVEGRMKPAMPPKKARQPAPEEIRVLRAWVEAGAREDRAEAVALPKIKPHGPVQAPVTALAYRPDGKQLAAGGYREVVLIDPDSADVAGHLQGLPGQVTALAYSRDGTLLAVAGGEPGQAGEVRVYAGQTLRFTLAAHRDEIFDLAFSPDGRVLASCGYDRLVRLWDAQTGATLRTLKDHSDTVYALAFSPDGKLLASASADRAVKVWEVATGRRLHTLAEATDWVYALAWSPAGPYLAGAGVDKTLRVWEVAADRARLARAVFAHEGPVTRLAYSADGKTLYSLGEDRATKAWDADRLVERVVYPRQPETPLALAVRTGLPGASPQLAVGRYDGALVLLDEATGKVQAEPLPVKPRPPVLQRLTPPSGQRGQSIRLRLEGQHLDGALELTGGPPGSRAEFVAGVQQGAREVLLTVPETTPAGNYTLGLKNAAGQSATLPFTVDLFPLVLKDPRAGSASPHTCQVIKLPATVAGALDRAGAVDFYRFEAAGGQEVGVQALTAALGSKLEPVLLVVDASGHTLAESANGLLGFTCPLNGTYALGIRDREYRGEGALHYRLQVGNVPVVTSIFPPGLQRGTERDIRAEGVHLGRARTVRLKAGADTVFGARLPVPLATPGGPVLGDARAVVGEFPEVLSTGKEQDLPVPGTANGRVEKPGATETWRFAARKGQRLLLEVNARRIGSPLDSVLEVLDERGQPLPRATLRCLSKTYTVFRDHDSATTGIRIESWSDLAINDYLLVGEELLKIRALPRNPDDDCSFFGRDGQRLGYLGTTPAYLPLGLPMYKVAVHPPGATFPPNGLPVVTLYYRNDDGGPGFSKDSAIVFDPPADKIFKVRVGDARGQGGIDHVYRLTVRPPQPSFSVGFNPTHPVVPRGSGVPVTVTAQRVDGFDGDVAVRLENLPPGLSAPATTIPAGEDSTSFALFADGSATVPPGAAPLKLVARATVSGREVVSEVTGGVPRLEEAGDLVTTTEQTEVAIRPGGEARVTARVERRRGFAGRVPLEVLGLPHGVRVLDVGLNGILITEKESSRTFVIFAEPWVKPQVHPFVVLARREGRGGAFAAPSLRLHVTDK